MSKTGTLIALCPLVLAGCLFDSSGVVPTVEVGADAGQDAADPGQDAAPGPDGGGEPDAPPPLGIEDVLHVPAAAETGGTGDLILKDSDVIDTGTRTINGAGAPTGTVFDTSPQDDSSGPELAVLHVRNLEVEQGATVRVVGTRPLVIIADGTVIVAGVLDASATRDQPGPGGAGAAQGPGAGGAGEHQGQYRDSGGGGAGHATAGGKGGDSECTQGNCGDLAVGGAAGDAYGDPGAVLQAGSGGGAASPSCAPASGAGGGAIHIYAAESITITADGGIHAGGGGGSGGRSCAGQLTSGAGGGSGGSIVLQSRTIDHRGIIAANGGGGGGGAGYSGLSTDNGEPGQNGQLSTAPAAGGSGGNNVGFDGGAGGALDAEPGAGENTTAGDSNGGGGGGAAGTIVLATSDTLMGDGQASPAATTLSY